MNPCEQFFTSLCSRKTYSIIKTHRRPIHDFGIHTEGDFDFHLDDCVTIFMRFHQSSEPSNQELEELIIDGNTIRYELKEDNLTTYWAEPREGTMKLIEYMCDLFNIEVEEMVMHCDSTDSLMKWIQSRQTHLCVVSFTSNDSEENQFDPETLTSLIMDCQIAKSIKLDAYTTEPFQIQNLQKRCDCFHVDIGTWVTVENLMTMDCIDILVTRKPFTSTEMNRFIKHWINGGSPRLAFLGVALEDYNEQELMDGIDVKYNIRKHFRKGTTGYIHKLDGFYEIQKTTNGMKAGFKYKDGVLFFAVWPSHLFLNPPCCFRLFRLPHLVFMNIINAMEATEQFMTSLCSRRAFDTIKTLRRRSQDIMITAGDKCLILERSDEKLAICQYAESLTPFKAKINGHSVSFVYRKDYSIANTFWAEPILGTMELVKHVTSLFSIQVDTAVIKNDSGTRFMNWVQKRQGSLRLVQVNSYNPMENQFESEDLKNIIMECEADHIQLNALHSSSFEIQNLNKKFEVFECLRGTWITVDNLIMLDCVKITVQEKQFTSAEINRFIKHWLQGGSHRLKSLRIILSVANEQEILDGLNAHLNVKKMNVIHYHPDPLDIFLEIVRRDGTRALLQTLNGYFSFVVLPKDNGGLLDLNMLVW